MSTDPMSPSTADPHQERDAREAQEATEVQDSQVLDSEAQDGEAPNTSVTGATFPDGI